MNNALKRLRSQNVSWIVVVAALGAYLAALAARQGLTRRFGPELMLACAAACLLSLVSRSKRNVIAGIAGLGALAALSYFSEKAADIAFMTAMSGAWLYVGLPILLALAFLLALFSA